MRGALRPLAGVRRLSGLPAVPFHHARFRTHPGELAAAHAGGARLPATDPSPEDFDDIVLDDLYYQEMGLKQDGAALEMASVAGDVDPEGVDLLSLEDASQLSEELPQGLKDYLSNTKVYGPEVMVLAGFRAEETGMVRAVLDSAGGQAIAVLPANQDMLLGSVDAAIHSAEVDWSQPRPQGWIQGGGWGAQRAVLFGGLSLKVQATVLELLESAGLPPLAATVALEEDGGRRLGDVLAEAVKALKERQARASGAGGLGGAPLMRGRSGWEGTGRVVAADAGLPPPEALLRQEQQRQQQQQAAAEGPATEGAEEAQAGSAGSSAVDEAKAHLGALKAKAADMAAPNRSPPSASSRASAGPASRQPTAAAPSPAAAKPVPATRPTSRPPAKPQPPSPSDGGFGPVDTSLDDLMASLEGVAPPPTAPAAAPASAPTRAPAIPGDGAARSSPSKYAPAAANAAGSAAASASGASGQPTQAGMLDTIQSALKAGASPEELKRLIDDAYGQLQRREEPPNVMPALAPAPGSSSSAGGGASNTGGSAAKATAPGAKRPAFGPQPPPAVPPMGPGRGKNQVQPLLKLRPELEQALASGKNIQFVDLNKLPSRYRQQYMSQSQRPQQPAGAQQVPQASSRGAAGLAIDPQALDDADDGDSYVRPAELDASELTALAASAAEQGLDLQRLLAEVMAAGFSVPAAAAHQAGLSLPDNAMVRRVREEQQLE